MSNQEAIDKLKKLLALSKSSNEHEAAVAAARATELMQRYQISHAELETTEEENEPIEEQNIGGVDKRIFQWKGMIAQAIAIALNCQAFFRTFIDRTDDTKSARRVQLRVIGRTSDVQTVEYLFSYLVNEINSLADALYDPESDPVYQRAERLGKHFSHRSHAARQWKDAFRLGAADVVSDRIQEQYKRTVDTVREEAKHKGDHVQALVRVDNALARLEDLRKAVQAAIDAKKLRKATAQACVRDDGYQRGKQEGGKINLHGGKALGKGQNRLGDGK